MIELLRHKVRFGELSYGPLLHYAMFFDLLIQATEELCYELDYSPEAVVEAEGVPFAPVAIHAGIERYPRYEDTIVVTGAPASVGETNVQFDYRFVRRSDGVEFGHATMAQVIITPEHTAASIPPELRARLEELGGGEREPVRIDTRNPAVAGPGFRHDVTFRTPHLEAAGLGYFEDYAREMAIGLEAYLESRGRSLGELTEGTYPFVPVAWDLVIERSIEFEDEIAVVGRVLDATDDAVEIAYEFRRATTDEVCIRASLTYGCFEGKGERVAFPAAATEALVDGGSV